MIICKDNIFLLKNENFSYMFMTDSYGILRHLHFGAPMNPEDAQALTC